jgi:hypothetical protein
MCRLLSQVMPQLKTSVYVKSLAVIDDCINPGKK